MPFAIGGTEPPAYAIPTIMYPPILRIPSPQGRNGNGVAITYGLPYALVGREWISQTGFTWWETRMGNVTVTLLDPTTNTWKNYTGIARIMTYDPDTDFYLANFTVRIDNLEVVV